MKPALQLCGSHLAFYACPMRGTRGSRQPGRDCAPNQKAYQPGQPYQCLAPTDTHAECPSRDRGGAAHRRAGIVIPIQEVRHAAA